MKSILVGAILVMIGINLLGTAQAQGREEARSELQLLNRMIDRDERSRDFNWIATQIAARYATTRDVVLQDRRDCDCSWGQIMMARSIARETGRPTREIWNLRRQGMGWGNIARRYGLTLGEVMRDARAHADWTDNAGARARSDDDSRGQGKGGKAKGRR